MSPPTESSPLSSTADCSDLQKPLEAVQGKRPRSDVGAAIYLTFL
jgi:hypothetical protein